MKGEKPMTNLSNELCDICGLKYCKEKVVINNGQTPNVDIKPFYLDFEQAENYKKLQEIFINHDHSITLSKGWYAISNGDTDFVNDMHDTSFAISGTTFLKAVCNYLIKDVEKIKQAIRETEWKYE